MLYLAFYFLNSYAFFLPLFIGFSLLSVQFIDKRLVNGEKYVPGPGIASRVLFTELELSLL